MKHWYEYEPGPEMDWEIAKYLGWSSQYIGRVQMGNKVGASHIVLNDKGMIVGRHETLKLEFDYREYREQFRGFYGSEGNCAPNYSESIIHAWQLHKHVPQGVILWDMSWLVQSVYYLPFVISRYFLRYHQTIGQNERNWYTWPINDEIGDKVLAKALKRENK